MRYGGILPFTVLAAVGSACAAVSSAEPGLPAGRELALPVVQGSAGPFRHVVVTLTHAAGKMGGAFTGMLRADGGASMALPGPSEPDDFFLLDPRSVIFTPVDRSGRNGIVILYDSSQIGPGNGTQRRALVYKIGANIATREPVLEACLAGAFTAAMARARLAAAVR